MGTHPIFESDFDCLTELGPKSHGWQKEQHSGQRPLPQGLEAKSPNLVQPARSKGATTKCPKGQGRRYCPTTVRRRSSTNCPMPDCSASPLILDDETSPSKVFRPTLLD